MTPWTVASQALLSIGFSRQEYWSGLPFPSPGDLPESGIKPTSLCLLHWQAGSYHGATLEAHCRWANTLNLNIIWLLVNHMIHLNYYMSPDSSHKISKIDNLLGNALGALTNIIYRNLVTILIGRIILILLSLIFMPNTWVDNKYSKSRSYYFNSWCLVSTT